MLPRPQCGHRPDAELGRLQTELDGAQREVLALRGQLQDAQGTIAARSMWLAALPAAVAQMAHSVAQRLNAYDEAPAAPLEGMAPLRVASGARLDGSIVLQR